MVKKLVRKNSSGKNSKIIGLDLDGVIVDHTKMKIRLAKKRGFNLRPKDTHPEFFEKALPLPQGKLIKYFIHSHPIIALQAPLMPWAKRGLDQLKQSKMSYVLVSRQHEPEAAKKLLRRHGLWPRYFNEKNAFFVLEKEDKNELAKKLGITHFVDDEAEVLAKLTSVKNRFLFDQHNVFRKTSYPRVKTWPKLIEKLLEA